MNEAVAIPPLVARAIEALEGFDGRDLSRIEPLEAVVETPAPFAEVPEAQARAAAASWARLTSLTASAVAALLRRVGELEAGDDAEALAAARWAGERAQHALGRLSAGMRPAPTETT